MKLITSASYLELAQIQETLQSILLTNILPFWHPRIIDFNEGGYCLNHDHLGRFQGKGQKSLVSQARTVWFFSRLFNSSYGADEHLKAAQWGYEFLRECLWDQQHGGFYWAVDESGKIATSSGKHLYGQAFAIYALSEYAIASKDTGAIQLADSLFNLLETYAYDVEHGGYRESFQADWQSVPPDEMTYLGTPAAFKLLNTHLHLMEALEVYYRVKPNSHVREKLTELILINSNAVVRKSIGTCSDQYHPDWLPVDTPSGKRTSYGHSLENLWLLALVRRTLGLSNSPLIELYQTLFKYALRYGYDKRRGGFYESGYFNQIADKRTKIWWVQAECLVAALQMYKFTKERIYFRCFCQTLSWIVNNQVDWQRGEWHRNILPNGRPEGYKAGAWKAPYHNGRAMLQCLELIKEMRQADEVEVFN